MITRLKDYIYEAQKIRLDNIRYLYHWVNEGNLFEQVYDASPFPSSRDYVLRKYAGKKLQMPKLPKERLMLGEENEYTVCMTIDPSYESAGYTGESDICLVFDAVKLMQACDFKDFSDNGESELRFLGILDWDVFLKNILITKKCYDTGNGWEGFFYRPVSEWLPERLKGVVETYSSTKAICNQLIKKYNNELISV